MVQEAPQSFSREFKLEVVRRIEAGENVSALARELTVKREILYRWRDAHRLGGPEALRLRGRPSKAEGLAMAQARSQAGKANDLAEARWQIEQGNPGNPGTLYPIDGTCDASAGCAMARLARAVAPGVPHHVTQRGNRRQTTFFGDDDYAAYSQLISESCHAAGVEVWAYCLMPNHVHLILTPQDEDGLRAALGEAHRRYSRRVNFREGWRGYLWQGRFASVAMDERHLMACARYVEMNPVRAHLVERPETWPWSSAAAHLAGRDDRLVTARPLLARAPDWQAFLDSAVPQADYDAIRRGERTGRPLGAEDFVHRLEESLGRPLAPRKPGRKPNAAAKCV